MSASKTILREPRTNIVVKDSLKTLAETGVPFNSVNAVDPDRQARRRRHRWMLILAFEVLVFGAAQAVLRPIRPPGVVVEQAVTPNHVVT